jgi:uncharacterized protein YrrD
MLRKVKDILGSTIRATDGDIGSVRDLYFDDHEWSVRYMVVETGPWLFGKQVLISPDSMEQFNWEDRALYVSLTTEQVKNAPDVDLAQPISREQARDVNMYYGWSLHWLGFGDIAAPAGAPGAYTGIEAAEPRRGRQWAEPRDHTPEPENETTLRSAREVMGYDVQASDEKVGNLEDIFVDEASWRIHYLVVDTGGLLPGKQVLIAREWVQRFDWARSEVYVDIPRDRIETAPEYDPEDVIRREYEDRLYEHYQFPRPWAM